MIRAKTEELKHIPWFAKAGAACSIVPISRFVGPNIFALKGGGYGCLFSLSGLDEEGLTDLELESRVRSIEGSLRGLPEGSCLYQYTRVTSGFDLPRQSHYANEVTETFASDRISFLKANAGFRRIDLHWCLTIEPSQMKSLGSFAKPASKPRPLQSFLSRGQNHPSADLSKRYLYMLDESSLASTKQMRSFLSKLNSGDRVLVIGDTRQHQSVEAGRPFQQMHEAGMQTSHLNKIMRQKDPELLKAVQHLANAETVKGIAMLAEQGRVIEIENGPDRVAAIAKDYASRPENTIIVSPDNRSRQQINQAVRQELRRKGTLAQKGTVLRTLSHRSDMTGADRKWAARYDYGDVLQYTTGSKAEGIDRNSFSTVRSVDARANTLTVELEDGSPLTYDPRRLRGVNVFREVEREFAVGDRLQWTALRKELGVANRDLGTVIALEEGKMTLQMDGKARRMVMFDPRMVRQFDHGYAVTSHSSQGLTADRVLVHIDTNSSRSLINNRLAYVSISRASDDARVYTNNAEGLGERLAHDIPKTTALDVGKESQLSAFRGVLSHSGTDVEFEGFSFGL
jgi:AAA domain/Viral (Superfamily 1) RNA helicase